MKIVLVGPFAMQPKGTVKARALPLARVLAARGHQVSVLIPPWDWPSDAGVRYALDAVEVVNVRLGPRLPLLAHLAILLRLLRELWRRDPDVVHVFKPKGYSGAVALLLRMLRALRLARARIVVDTDDWEGRGGWNDVGDYGRLLKLLVPVQETWTLRCADAITVASRALMEKVAALGVPRCRAFYVPNGPGAHAEAWLGSNPAAPAASADASHPALLLYTRFLEFEPARVAQIFGRVCQEIPQAELWVLGAGFRGEERSFLQAMAAVGLAERVHLLGWVNEQAVADHLARAAVALYPYEDNLINRTKCSVKLVELLAFGLAVVADRVGENAAYIEDGLSGLLVEPGDAEAFARAVITLLRDEGARKRLGQNARRRIEQRFLWSTLATPVEAAYRC